jgi:hypothetical protein
MSLPEGMAEKPALTYRENPVLLIVFVDKYHCRNNSHSGIMSPVRAFLLLLHLFAATLLLQEGRGIFFAFFIEDLHDQSI